MRLGCLTAPTAPATAAQPRCRRTTDSCRATLPAQALPAYATERGRCRQRLNCWLNRAVLIAFEEKKETRRLGDGGEVNVTDRLEDSNPCSKFNGPPVAFWSATLGMSSWTMRNT